MMMMMKFSRYVLAVLALLNRADAQCCPNGFTGDDCLTQPTPCTPDPCKNGGVCTEHGSAVHCACKPGYIGNRCRIQPNPCIPDPCKNGEVCTEHGSAVHCACKPGYSGNMCRINIDECASDPCQNGATCDDHVNGFDCQCATGWKGPICEDPYWYCGFDDQGMCSMTQDMTGGMEWTLLSGRTPSISTGPSSAFGGAGYYIYLETSRYYYYVYGVEMSARIYTPGMLPVFVGPACVQFAYHMYGSEVSMLRMYTQSGDSAPMTTVWELSGNQGDIWVLINVDVDIVSTDLRVGFEAILYCEAPSSLYTYYYEADIAVDEISIVPGSCGQD